MKVRVIQWLGYTGVSYALASAGITPADWRFWLSMAALVVAACANYYEGRTLAAGVQSCPLCGANAAAGRHGEGCCVAAGIVIPPVDGARALGSYRLVERGEVIERGDELLADDTLTWLPVAGWTVGTKWDGGVYVPVRRRNAGVVPTQKGQQE